MTSQLRIQRFEPRPHENVSYSPVSIPMNWNIFKLGRLIKHLVQRIRWSGRDTLEFVPRCHFAYHSFIRYH